MLPRGKRADAEGRQRTLLPLSDSSTSLRAAMPGAHAPPTTHIPSCRLFRRPPLAPPSEGHTPRSDRSDTKREFRNSYQLAGRMREGLVVPHSPAEGMGVEKGPHFMYSSKSASGASKSGAIRPNTSRSVGGLAPRACRPAPPTGSAPRAASPAPCRRVGRRRRPPGPRNLREIGGFVEQQPPALDVCLEDSHRPHLSSTVRDHGIGGRGGAGEPRARQWAWRTSSFLAN